MNEKNIYILKLLSIIFFYFPELKNILMLVQKLLMLVQ